MNDFTTNIEQNSKKDFITWMQEFAVPQTKSIVEELKKINNEKENKKIIEKVSE